jgi:penicillin-binding protein 1A
VQAAARFYFGVPVTQLDCRAPDQQCGDSALALARAATLAGMAPAPSVWNPVHDPKAARARELYVLNRMIANHFISPQQASDAYALPAGSGLADSNGLPHVVRQSEPDAPTIAPEFRDLVQVRLHELFPATFDTEMFASGGVRVRTTLDLDLEKAAIQALHQVLPGRDDPEAAIAAVDPRTGDIRALAEKKNGGYQKGGLDLAVGIARNSGSTIKPFTLATALMHGHSLDEGVPAPECIQLGRGYRPCNAEKGSSYQTLRSALVESINTVYAPLAVHVGLKRVVALARAAGMDIGHLDGPAPGVPYPSYSLGVPTNPLSEAVAYGTLVDHGVHHVPNSLLSVRSADDGSLFETPGKRAGDRVVPRRVADQVTDAMGEVVSSGTGTAARQPFPVYGKTGTTDNFLNAWFTGCSSSLCISVWMGYDREYVGHCHCVPHSMKHVEGVDEVFGGTLPAKIFAKTFDDYRALQAPKPSPSPSVTATRSSAPPVYRPQPPVSTVRRSPRPKPSRAPTPTTQPSTAPSPSSRPTPSLLPSPP